MAEFIASPGIWGVASAALNRPVRIEEPYPHICGMSAAGRITPGVVVQFWRRDCAACAEDAKRKRGAA